jgi:hypothetical protein
MSTLKSTEKIKTDEINPQLFPRRKMKYLLDTLQSFTPTEKQLKIFQQLCKSNPTLLKTLFTNQSQITNNNRRKNIDLTNYLTVNHHNQCHALTYFLTTNHNGDIIPKQCNRIQINSKNNFSQNNSSKDDVENYSKNN